MKKVLSVILSAILIFSLAVPAFAAGNYKEYPINYMLQSSQADKAYELSKCYKNK